jgi:tRNA (guanine37-N1)-methyltransferase
MQIDVVTIFPDAFRGVLDASILGRAIEAGIVDIGLHDLRDWTDDRHRSVDDAPYGGGAGMVMRPGPWFRAIEELRSAPPAPHVVLCTPQGRPFSQEIAKELAQRDRLILCAARYEGVDDRVREHLVDDEISIGDYVLSGGEIPAMVLIDAVVRLLPGALGSDESTVEESFNDSLLEYPHYTRPAEFRGWQVPEVLLGGNHAKIARWRRGQRIRRTAQRRPDLLAGADVTPEELDDWAVPDDDAVE